MKTPKSSNVAVQKKRGATEVMTPVSDNLQVMTRSRLKRLSASSRKEVCESTKKSLGTTSKSENLTNTRRDLLSFRIESQGKASVTPKSTSSRKSRRNILLETKTVSSHSDDSVIYGRMSLRRDKSLKSDSNVQQHVTNTDTPVNIALKNEVIPDTNTIIGLCGSLKPVVVLNDVVKNGRGKPNASNSETNCLLRSTELSDFPLLSSNSDELSLNHSQNERKVNVSGKSKSSPPNKNEWIISPVTDHASELANEINVTESHLKSVTCPFRSTELSDGPLISNNDELSPHHSQKERRIKKSRKSKSSPLNKNEWVIHSVSEHITELENETDMLKSHQNSDNCQNTGSLIVNASPLQTEIDECLKSPGYTKCKEAQLKSSADTGSTSVDKLCETNKINDTDVYVPQNVFGNSVKKVHKKEKMHGLYSETESDEILEDIQIGRLDSEEEIGTLKSTDADNVLISSPKKEQDHSGMKSPFWQGMSVENHYFSNISVLQDSLGSQTKCMENKYKVQMSPVCKSQMRKEMKSESSESDSDAESRKAIMESAQKRIIHNISTSESESRKFVKPLTNSTRVKDTSDSDSAPEDMSFSAGRQLVVQSLKNAVESIQKEKHRRKEKRKQRLEKYKQQKEEKLIRLKEKRASQEDASCSSSEESGYEEVDVPSAFEKSNKKQDVKWEKENLDDPPQSKVKRFHSDSEVEPKERKEKKRKQEQKGISQHFGNLRKLPADVLGNLPDQAPVKLQTMDNEATSKEKSTQEKCNKYEGVKDKRQDFRSQSDVDYIPLSTSGATEFGVMPLDSLMRAPKSMAEQAAEFRQRMLFGSRIRRGPSSAQTIYQQKLKASGKDRLVR